MADLVVTALMAGVVLVSAVALLIGLSVFLLAQDCDDDGKGPGEGE